MRIQLTRDCIVGPSEDRNKLNSAKAGAVIEVPEKHGKELLRLNCATDKITANK